MRDSIQTITLELNDSVSQEVVRMFTSDAGRKLRIRFTSNGKPFELNDADTSSYVAVYADNQLIGAVTVYDEEYAEIELIAILTTGIYNCIAQIAYDSGSDRRIYNSPKFTLIIEKGIENDD